MIAATLLAAPAAQAAPVTGQDLDNWTKADAWANDPRVPLVIFGGKLEPGCKAPAVMSDRLNRAAMFLRSHPKTPVIATGGVTRPGCGAEADAMELGLRMRNIPNPVIKERRSDTTVQNARNVSEMWKGKHMIAATSDNHAHRASNNLRDHGKRVVALTFGF